MLVELSRKMRIFFALRKVECKTTGFTLVTVLSLCSTCLEYLVLFDFKFLVYAISGTWLCIIY